MKLGIFDSGLGGVLIARSIRKTFPDIDIMYLGDTLHMPYGNRSAEAIYQHSKACMEAMFAADCRMIIMACNTASASALRRLQQDYLPDAYADRRILGVVVPTIEYALDRGYTNLGLIGTNYTVSTNVYEEELRKINPDIRIAQVKTPLLVPLIEHDGGAWLDSVLDSYLEPLAARGIEALLLGCTHYVALAERIKARYDFEVIAQDEIVPVKLAQYFERHPEIYGEIGRGAVDDFYVSDLTDGYAHSALKFYGPRAVLKQMEMV
jgi:glutamate racemase